ncbi:hypothetical protein BLNAU_1398 [Blattamonas nauphoetae]|uniref:Protein kinase domain-containing protein n=1 Tax=Blattamonas nauphoetae TaxID=2049346 RepID=A0ABQ9YJS2_9EUKA|nr:hypothetical protein BLNAU_1398 [Blattamonas nauphoetae]
MGAEEGKLPNPIASHVRLDGFYTSSELLLEDRNLILQGTSNTMISEDKMKSASSLFKISNSTVSFWGIGFDLTDGLEIVTKPFLGTPVKNKLSCAQVSNSFVSTEKCRFIFEGTSSFFVLSASINAENVPNTIVLTYCIFEAVDGTILPLCHLAPDMPLPVHNDIYIASSVFSDLEIESSSGIAASECPDPMHSISTTITAVILRNLTRNGNGNAFERISGRQSVRVLNSALDRVTDGLYGTVTTPLQTAHSFLCQNTSFSQIMNTDHHTHNPSNYTFVGQPYDADDKATHFSATSLADPLLFVRCTITSTNPSSSFTFITLMEHQNSLTVKNCSFTVITTTRVTVRLVYLHPQTGSCPTLTIDELKSEYTATDQSVNAQSIIHVTRSASAHITGSTFSSSTSLAGARPLFFYSATYLVHIFGCVFSDASVNENGGVVKSGSGGELIMSDCLMENNFVSGNGGCVQVGRQCVTFHRCVARNNQAARGGVLASSSLTLSAWEDCHFEGNQAREGLHYSGNDLFFSENLNSYNSSLMVSCTSSSASPKISYYHTAQSNGVHPKQNILLPDPSTKTDSEQKLFVDLEGSGEECTEDLPCSSIDAALTKMQESTRNLIMIGTGVFADTVRTISGSVELVGNGWIRDSSFFTTLTSAGMKVGDGGNVTLRSMTLLPSTDDLIVVGMDEEGTLRLSFIRIDLIASHSTSLVSLSNGSTTLFRCWFDKVNLTDSPFVSVSGSASLIVLGTYFMLISREDGEGASCIDSLSTGAISFDASDFGNCSSSGKAGALHLRGKDGFGSVSFIMTSFYNNKASTESTGTDGSHLFAHDIILEDFASNQISETALKSFSPQISFLRLGVPTRLSPVSNFGYSNDGIDFPLAGKYYQAVPMTQFSSVKIMTEQTFKYCTSVAPILSGVTLTLEPLFAEEVTITFRYAIFVTSTSSQTLVTVGQNATFMMSERSISFSEVPTVTPFKVEAATGVLYLYIETVQFSCPTTSMPVPLFSISAGTLRFFKVTLSKSLSFASCSLIDSTGGTVRLDSTAFKQISSTGNGSVVHATSTTIGSDSCCFENCSAKNGGAIWFEVTGSNYLQIVHPTASSFSTTFLNCAAKEKGGAVCVEGSSSLSNPIRFYTNDVNHARFSGSSSGSSGKDVFVGENVFGSRPSSEIVLFGGGSYSDWHHVEIAGRGADEDELRTIGFLVPLPTVSVNGSVEELTTGLSGRDIEACKWTSSFCATLGYGIGILKSKYNGENVEMKAQFVWNMTYTESPMVVSDQNVVLTGKSATNQNKCDIHRTLVKMNEASTTGSPLFTITNKAIFSVSNIDFILRDQNGLFAMDATGDTLKLVDCVMIASSGSVSSESVISVEGGSVWMNEITLNTSGVLTSQFSSPLISIHSSGGPISIQHLTISNLVFPSSSIVHLVTDTTMAMTDISFEGCSSSSKDYHLVFVEGTDFLNQILPSSWEGSFSNSTNLMDLWGMDSSLSSSAVWKETSLLFYLFPPTTNIILNTLASNTTDHPNCGSAKFCCQSLDSAFSSLRDSISVVLFESEAKLTSHITVSETSSFISSSPSAKILKMTEAGSIEVDGLGVVLKMEWIEVSCLSPSSVSTLISIMSGNLEMENCVIGSSSASAPLVIPSSVVSLITIDSSATASLRSSSISHAVFTHPSLGNGVVVNLDGSFELDEISSMSKIESNGTGSHVLMVGDSFSSIAGTGLMQRLKPSLPSSGSFSAEERNRLAGCVDGETDEIVFEWYPSSTVEVHVRSEGVDHTKGGHPALPQRTILFAVSQLAGDGRIVVDSDLTLSQHVITPSSSLTIRSAETQNTNKEVEVLNGGHFSVRQGQLSLTSLFFFTSLTASPFITLTSPGSLTITSSSFSGFSSLSAGSVLSASLDSTNTLSITTTEFSDCHSEMDGGAIALSLSPDTQSSQIVIKASFSSCSCGQGKLGDWVFVEGSYLRDKILPPHWEGFPSSFGTENENTLWGTDALLAATPFGSFPLLVYLLERKDDVIHVNSLGQDVIGCGSSKWPCGTLSSSLNHLLNGSSSQLRPQDSPTLSSTIVNKWNNLKICGSSDESKDIFVDSDGQITVPILQLSLSFLDFHPTTILFDHSLISISGSGSLVVDSCSFTSFHSSASGSVVCGTLSSSSKLHLTKSNMSSCSSEGSGGVISINCEESLPSSSLVIDCCFDSDCSCGSDSKGKWVFVEGYGFEDLISEETWRGSCSGLTSPSNDSLLFGVDHSEPPNSMFHSLSLLYYLTEYRSRTIFVGQSGRDSNGCGDEARMCRRLERGHSHLKGSTDYELFVVGAVSLTEPLVFAPNDLELRPKSGRETIKVEGEGHFEDGDMTENHLLSVQRIEFNLDSATCPTLFKTGVGQLVLTSCSFEKSGVFDVEIVNLVGGEVSIENTSFHSISFSRAPFVFRSFKKADFEKVTFELCSAPLFVNASGNGETTKLSLESCHFSGQLESPSMETNSEGICSWSSGMLHLTNTSATIRSVDFEKGANGGIIQRGGSLSLINTTFAENSPSLSRFPSVRHNVMCSENGTISLSLDESQKKDLWIGGNECEIKNGTESHFSPFFIPTLDSSNSKSELNKKNKTFSITLAGSTLIPCDLFLEVFEEKGSHANSSLVSLPLAESSTQSFNETLITLEVNQSTLEKELNGSLEWNGRLSFGKGVRSGNHFLIKMSQSDEKKAQTSKAVSIIIPVAASLLALVLLVLVVVLVLCRHRRKKTELLANQRELDHVQVDGDGVKVDLLDDLLNVKYTDDLIKAEMSTHSGIETLHEETSRDTSFSSEPIRPSDGNGKAPLVQVLRCEGDLSTEMVARTDTLFDRLHGDTKSRMDKRVVMIELTRALQKVRVVLPEAEVLTHLSSHWVLFDRNENMFIQLQREKKPLNSQTIESSLHPPPSQHTHPPPFVHPPHQPGSGQSADKETKSTSPSSNNRPRESFFREDEPGGKTLELSTTQNENDPTDSISDSLLHFDLNENIALRHSCTQPVPQTDVEAVTAPTNPQTNTAFEGLRWQAPEVVQNSVGVDREKAAVFSLGLILWEMVAEAVPFGEMDAVNAARQNEIGGLPRMSLISGQKERELIQRCLHTKPSSRPTLSSFLSSLSELTCLSSNVIRNEDHIS